MGRPKESIESENTCEAHGVGLHKCKCACACACGLKSSCCLAALSHLGQPSSRHTCGTRKGDSKLVKKRGNGGWHRDSEDVLQLGDDLVERDKLLDLAPQAEALVDVHEP